MKKYLPILALLILSPIVIAGDCPYCHGGADEYCKVEITPQERLYGEEIQVNITIGLLREFEPIDENSKVSIEYYNKSAELTRIDYKTDETGIIKFVPEITGYHLIRACGHAILIYVNSSCGDGICACGETRETCILDCSSCGDGICDEREDLDCMDCAECGDSSCTAGENRENCIEDCAFCGDGICDYVENRGSCPSDCGSGNPDSFCDEESDGICDPDCDEGRDEDCMVRTKGPGPEVEKARPKEEGSGQWLIVSIIIAAAVFITLYFCRLKVSKAEGELPKKKSA